MIALILWMVILILVFGILVYAVDILPWIEPPFKQVAKAVLCIGCALLLLAAVMNVVPLPRWP